MKKWLAMMVCGIGVAGAAESPRVEQALQEFDSHVAQLREVFARKPANPDDIAWVRAKLTHMVALDQYYRTHPQRIRAHEFSPQEQQAYSNHLYAMDIDGRNLADLRPLLDKYGWFRISQFGIQADSEAFLLVQHADRDLGFQKKMLAILEPLAKAGETDPKNFAYLFDRVAVHPQGTDQRGLQRFGTQGQCTGPGTWEPHPVEDPERLEERRQALGLMPETEYKKLFKDLCHESTEETLRKAREAAAPVTTP